MSMIIDGTNGLTFNNATTQASAGQVLQVVSSTFAGPFSQATSGSTYYATGHSVSITPKFSTSKILVIASGFVSSSNTSSWGVFTTIYRGSTNLASGSGTQAFASMYGSTALNFSSTVSMQYLDSPATTSSTTYQVYIGGGGATVQWASTSGYANNTQATLTVMEIAA